MGEKGKNLQGTVQFFSAKTSNVLPGEEARLVFDYLIYLLINSIHLL